MLFSSLPVSLLPGVVGVLEGLGLSLLSVAVWSSVSSVGDFLFFPPPEFLVCPGWLLVACFVVIGVLTVIFGWFGRCDMRTRGACSVEVGA